MIKNFRVLRLASNKTEFQQLSEFFSTLGLTLGEHWEGRSNSGKLFASPEGNIEIGVGEGFPHADIIFEVADADNAYEALKKSRLKKLSAPEDTPYGFRLFLAEVASFRFAFYSYLPERQPAHAAALEAKLDARGRKFALVVSRFNSFITERLLEGALLALRQAGVGKDGLMVVRVPGAFEIPSMSRTLALSGKYDAIVCLGCLLRGDTLHYEVIANEVTRGIGQSAQETGVPHGFGVLTCDTLEQAIDRAGLKAGNKGFEAALAAIEMVELKQAAGRPKNAGRKPAKKAKGKKRK